VRNNRPIFITGNPEKAEHFARLSGIDVEHKKLDLDEIQTIDHRELVEHKVRQAYAATGQAVLVEDVFFNFETWGGLPGPFVKFFVVAPGGVENMCRMLDGFDNRRAQAVCMYGYYDGVNLEFFEGSLSGEIAQHPRGERGYGFDRIFIPDEFGGDRTAAELTAEEYEQYYTNIKPYSKIAHYLHT
jgi:non-canonical purine NTP pyrophosphatase (RdgB/HAM1 family)